MVVKTITRKLEIYPVGDNRNDFYSWLNNEIYVQNKAKQFGYNYGLERMIVVDKIKDLVTTYDDELFDVNQKIDANKELMIELKDNDKRYKALMVKNNKLIEKRNKLLSSKNKDSFNVLKESLGYNERTEVSKMAKGIKDFDGVLLYSKAKYKEHFNTGVDKGYADFKNDFKGLMSGEKSARLYKKNSNLDVRLDNTDNREIKNFRFEKNKYYFDVTSEFTLAVNLGRKPSQAGQAKKTLEDVLNGNYVKRCDSMIRKEGNKVYLLLVLQQEVNEMLLDKNRIMGIDLGMDIPAYVSMEFKPEWGRAFGNKKELLDFKTKIKALKDREKHKSVYARGGHGRKRKLKNNHLEALKSRESNFSKTYNHTLSKQIVDYAVKNNIGTIRMEKLDSKGFKDKKVLGNWTYYQLQTMIENKASLKGIEIEYVNPAYTSKVCSNCGSYKENFVLGNRDGDDKRHFHCGNCGLNINSDDNASRNIAKGGIPKEVIDKIKSM